MTELVNEKLYEPNIANYVYEQTDVFPKYHDDDKYIYEIKQLSRKETRYCNALFPDRIDTTLGFSALEKAVGSILLYRKLNSYPFASRVDYSSLYKIIENIKEH